MTENSQVTDEAWATELLNSNQDSMYLIDRDGRVLEANLVGAERLKTTVSDLVGQSIFDFFPPDIAAERKAHWLEFEKQRKPVAFRDYSGGRRFETLITPYFSEAGDLVRASIIARDATERLQAEADIQAARKEAIVASKAKSNLLANMSHELRTPLNAILGFSDLIRNKVFGEMENARYAEYVENIYSSGEHLLELISDVLDLSSIEAGALEIQDEPVEVKELIESVYKMLRPQIENKRLKLNMDISDQLPLLMVDKRRVKQIVLNLLSNAIKFTPKGGEITVQANLTVDRALIVAISDTGIGMSEDDIRIAFTEFGQIDNFVTRSQEGTGLGLPLSKALIEQHGGELLVESVVDKGTRMAVVFPPERVL